MRVQVVPTLTNLQTSFILGKSCHPNDLNLTYIKVVNTYVVNTNVNVVP